MELYEISMISPCVRVEKWRNACSSLQQYEAKAEVYGGQYYSHSFRVRYLKEVDGLCLQLHEFTLR